ncbi:hypothetical protein ACEU2D_00940 [Brevibacillus laterosporus]|uniref:hypothetical protein n=1 Tax=Brevibacillus laterosporus TaxID=1465 RepID=UPI0035A6B168
MKKQTWNRAIFMVTVSLLTTSMITIGPEVTYASKGQASSIGAIGTPAVAEPDWEHLGM